MAQTDPSVLPDEPKNGNWFCNWLRARRFTDAEIAQRTGLTTATIGNYKRQTTELKLTFLLALEAIDASDLEQRLQERGG